MIDQSERAFRILCRRYGVTLAYTPMIHAEPFAANPAYRHEHFDAWDAAMWRGAQDADRPLIAQLGGDDPRVMLRAARLLEPYVDAVDVNLGCPTEDARRGGHRSHSPRCRRFGAYLASDVPAVQQLVGKLADGLRVPVTAKIRLQESSGATVRLARALEEAGAAAICVHGRTARQRPKYADRDPAGAAGVGCSWPAIAEVVREVRVPVIANGGVETRQDALACLQHTGAAAVMSSEALLERPDLFVDIESESEDPNGEQNDVHRIVRLAREFVDLAEVFPSPRKHAPTKPHLFKILHSLLGADQAEARRRDAAGLTLDVQAELKLVLMRCQMRDLAAIREAIDEVEVRYCADPRPPLGPPWYRRWRTEKIVPHHAANGQLFGGH